MVRAHAEAALSRYAPDVVILMVMEMEMVMEMVMVLGVVFPGSVYHPFRENGFSIKSFLDANINKFNVFICGPWKDGDASQQGYYEVPHTHHTTHTHTCIHTHTHTHMHMHTYTHTRTHTHLIGLCRCAACAARDL